MKTQWRVTGSDMIPTAVQCDDVGYPNLDADGQTQYENTHFGDEDQAWAKCEANHRAWTRHLRENVKAQEQRLSDARAKLAAAYEAQAVFADALAERLQNKALHPSGRCRCHADGTCAWCLEICGGTGRAVKA